MERDLDLSSFNFEARLDYQRLFEKMSPHSSPDQRPDLGEGGNRAYFEAGWCVKVPTLTYVMFYIALYNLMFLKKYNFYETYNNTFRLLRFKTSADYIQVSKTS